jgi:hypothetical protein
MGKGITTLSILGLRYVERLCDPNPDGGAQWHSEGRNRLGNPNVGQTDKIHIDEEALQ